MSSQSISRLVDSAKKLRSDRARALLSLGMVFGLGAVGTLAYWTDSATLTGGTFTSGTLDIKLKSGAAAAVDDNPDGFVTDFALANMAPGTKKAAILTVVNGGSLAFDYTATGYITAGSSGGELASALRFKVVPGGTLANNDCGGTPTYGTTAAGSALDANPATPSSVVATARTIAPGSGGTESFCVVATLPIGSGPDNASQDRSAVVTFKFAAKQVGT